MATFPYNWEEHFPIADKYKDSNSNSDMRTCICNEDTAGPSFTLTVRIPCQSPTSFLKSNTFTIVSAVQIKRIKDSYLLKTCTGQRKPSVPSEVATDVGIRSFHSVFAESLQLANLFKKASLPETSGFLLTI